VQNLFKGGGAYTFIAVMAFDIAMGRGEGAENFMAIMAKLLYLRYCSGKLNSLFSITSASGLAACMKLTNCSFNSIIIFSYFACFLLP
jgi:hypothetical protein